MSNSLIENARTSKFENVCFCGHPTVHNIYMFVPYYVHTNICTLYYLKHEEKDRHRSNLSFFYPCFIYRGCLLREIAVHTAEVRELEWTSTNPSQSCLRDFFYI